MLIFPWLLLGHLIGDWMLQTDWMARNKRGRWWSLECVVHCLVYTVAVASVVWFVDHSAISPSQLGLVFVTILISHWLIDGFNLADLWGRFINQTQADYVRIVVDQTMHLIVLGMVASFLL